MVLGPNDLEKNQFEVARRDTMAKEFMPMDNIAENIKKLLADIQKNLFDKAATLRSQRTYKVDTWDEFVDVIENKSGFALAHWTVLPKRKRIEKNLQRLRYAAYRWMLWKKRERTF